MFSGLSKGTKRALTFDQAARNIACIAEVLALSNRTAESFDRIGFVILAPKEQIDGGVFSGACETDGIAEKVKARCASYGTAKQRWFEESFLPLLSRVEPQVLSWEEIIQHVAEADTGAAQDLSEFFDRCLQFNRSRTARASSNDLETMAAAAVNSLTTPGARV
jgi:hypothetical protein